MTRSLALAVVAAVTLVAPLAAQHERGESRSRAEAPQPPGRRARPDAEPELDQAPHFYHGHWFGHASPNDVRFRLDRPFQHGIFAQAGPAHHFSVARFDRDTRRLWFRGGFGFEVAGWDWAFAADWCWTCGDDFVVYDDPDHAGWYLLYNIPTGRYVHVLYLGT